MEYRHLPLRLLHDTKFSRNLGWRPWLQIDQLGAARKYHLQEFFFKLFTNIPLQIIKQIMRFMHGGLLFFYISCSEDSGLSTTALSCFLHPVLIYYIHTLQFL